MTSLRRALGRWSSLTALAVCACSDPQPAACVATTTGPLVNAASTESYLGLAETQIAAIVQVRDATAPDGAACSGVFVAPDWVLTAKHCREIPSPEIVRTDGTADPLAETVAHPSLDLLLVRTSSQASGVDPLGTAAIGDPVLDVGTVAELAGYGLTENHVPEGLRFLAESIVAVASDRITVNGFGFNGACDGDSGGPLLARSASGSVVVAGVLSMGSALCNESDSFVRVDSERDWIASVIGTASPSVASCGTIDAVGRCLYGSALWCDADRLVAQACADGTQCGWSGSGFRCVTPSDDPCDGVDSVGACRNDVALGCAGGKLRAEDCSACGSCLIDGLTGGPFCGVQH